MKTKVCITCSALSALLLLSNSCYSFHEIRGSGDLVTEQISIGDYTEIKASNSAIDITYTQSDEAAGLRIVTDRNIFEKYNIRVEKGKLRIQPDEKYKNAHFKPTSFVVTTNSTRLRKVDFAGGSTFTTNSPLRTDVLDIDLAGSGKVNLNDTVSADKLGIDIAGSGTLNASAIEAHSFDADIAGSGKLNLGGHVTKASFDIAGSGTIRAFDLQVEDMECDIAGSGNIEITVNNSIDAEVAGSGRIRYKGDPPRIKSHMAGSGSIRKAD